MKLKIIEHKIQEQDLATVKKLHYEILAFKKKASLKNRNILEEEIKARRELIKEYYLLSYEYQLIFGKHKISLFSDSNSTPSAQDLKQKRHELFTSLRNKRAENRELEFQQRNYMGASYSLSGGVFSSPGSILGLIGKTDGLKAIRQNKIPMAKAKYVGIELELVCKVNKEQLEVLFVQAGLAGSVQVKSDGSLRADHPEDKCHEVVVLSKEANLEDVLKRVLAVLNSSTVKGYVNDSCGLHVHLDMRNRKHELAYSNLVYALPMLAAMVPNNRRSNNYCKLNVTSNFTEALSTVTPQGNSRYQAINPVAYGKYKTLEIRLHGGSLNFNKIHNWCKILVGIASLDTDLYNEIGIAAHYDFTLPKHSTTDPIAKVKSAIGASGTKLEDFIDARINKFKLQPNVITRIEDLDAV